MFFAAFSLRFAFSMLVTPRRRHGYAAAADCCRQLCQMPLPDRVMPRARACACARQAVL